MKKTTNGNQPANAKSSKVGANNTVAQNDRMAERNSTKHTLRK